MVALVAAVVWVGKSKAASPAVGPTPAGTAVLSVLGRTPATAPLAAAAIHILCQSSRLAQRNGGRHRMSLPHIGRVLALGMRHLQQVGTSLVEALAGGAPWVVVVGEGGQRLDLAAMGWGDAHVLSLELGRQCYVELDLAALCQAAVQAAGAAGAAGAAAEGPRGSGSGSGAAGEPSAPAAGGAGAAAAAWLPDLLGPGPQGVVAVLVPQAQLTKKGGLRLHEPLLARVLRLLHPQLDACARARTLAACMGLLQKMAAASQQGAPAPAAAAPSSPPAPLALRGSCSVWGPAAATPAPLSQPCAPPGAYGAAGGGLAAVPQPPPVAQPPQSLPQPPLPAPHFTAQPAPQPAAPRPGQTAIARLQAEVAARMKARTAATAQPPPAALPADAGQAGGSSSWWMQVDAPAACVGWAGQPEGELEEDEFLLSLLTGSGV